VSAETRLRGLVGPPFRNRRREPLADLTPCSRPPDYSGLWPATGSLAAAETVRVLVGPDQREFTVDRRLLCASSDYFRHSIEAVPASLASRPSSAHGRSKSTGSHPDDDLAIWLAGECPRMFALFLVWLTRRPDGFRAHMDATLAEVAPDAAAFSSPAAAAPPPDAGTATATAATASRPADGDRRCRALHWTLVKLHLFASLTAIPALQDAALDALQDLYLRRDWDMSPGFLRFLYAECDARSAARLRKWAVAMLAWTLSHHHRQTDHQPAAPPPPPAGEPGGSPAVRLRALVAAHPDLCADYTAHLAKMRATRASARIKNPQLRIPGNALRNEERHFGFRQCSFHSHRREVGEGPCPHTLPAAGRGGAAGPDDGADAGPDEELLLSPLSSAGSSASERSEARTPVDTAPDKGLMMFGMKQGEGGSVELVFGLG